MNFKTTIVLITLLAVVGVAVLFTRDAGEGDDATTVEQQQRVFTEIQPADVTRVAIAPANGKNLVLEKQGTQWRLLEPVNAPAETFEVDTLVRSLANLQATGEVTSRSADAQATGLASPQYTVSITAGAKEHVLLVGSRLAVGDTLYVSRKGDADTLVVSADLLNQIRKSPADFRDKKLVADYSTASINRVEIERPDGRIVLAKSGNDWKITEPQPMPAEKSEVDNILFDLTGLRATEFVSEDSSDTALYQLDRPRLTATLSATATTLPVGIAAATQPATAPATTQAAPLVVKFGGYDDVMKQGVYVTTSQSPVIARVSSNAFETVNKTPLQLRDRRVLEVDPEHVSAISISIDRPATTQPTTKPASKEQVVLKRRPEAPATTQPVEVATTQAATAPATQEAPAEPESKWVVADGEEAKPADDGRVESLLSSLHPLRARGFVETAPTTQPTATYVIHVTTHPPGGAAAQEHQVQLIDPGDAQPLVGTYNGLAFEVDRFFADRLSGDFLQGQAMKPPADHGDFE